jgi:hypothetical protein
MKGFDLGALYIAGAELARWHHRYEILSKAENRQPIRELR